MLRYGTLYVLTPGNRVLALDPGNGATRWVSDPGLDLSRRYAEGRTARGVALWTDLDASRGQPCATRAFLATLDARLIALDAATGLPCADFGERGAVHLITEVSRRTGRRVTPTEFSMTSPPAIARNLVIVGSAVRTTERRNAASGVVRAFDARTGALRWPDVSATRPSIASRLPCAGCGTAFRCERVERVCHHRGHRARPRLSPDRNGGPRFLRRYATGDE